MTFQCAELEFCSSPEMLKARHGCVEMASKCCDAGVLDYWSTRDIYWSRAVQAAVDFFACKKCFLNSVNAAFMGKDDEVRIYYGGP